MRKQRLCSLWASHQHRKIGSERPFHPRQGKLSKPIYFSVLFVCVCVWRHFPCHPWFFPDTSHLGLGCRVRGMFLGASGSERKSTPKPGPSNTTTTRCARSRRSSRSCVFFRPVRFSRTRTQQLVNLLVGFPSKNINLLKRREGTQSFGGLNHHLLDQAQVSLL